MMDESDIVTDLDQLRSRYEILRMLGHDAGEPVYGVRLRDSDRHFAVKVMSDSAARGGRPGALNGWQAHSMGPLHHPRLLGLQSVHHLQGGAVAVAMERRRGSTLAEALLAEGPFTADRAERIMREIAEALAYLHSRGVVHRAVGIHSIFLERDGGGARLGHFGIEKGTTAPVGTVERSAKARPRRVGPADDVHALGRAALAMLTGHPVESGDDEALLGNLAQPGYEAPPALSRAIQACLDGHAGKRPQTIDELLRLLDPETAVEEVSHAATGQLRPLIDLVRTASGPLAGVRLHLPSPRVVGVSGVVMILLGATLLVRDRREVAAGGDDGLSSAEVAQLPETVLPSFEKSVVIETRAESSAPGAPESSEEVAPPEAPRASAPRRGSSGPPAPRSRYAEPAPMSGLVLLGDPIR